MGMGGANVGPEFTAVEYDALEALAKREAALVVSDPTIKASGFFDSLAKAVDNSNRWQKWLQPDEKGLALTELSPERHAWMLKTCSRYIWTDPEVVAARERLYRNISPILPNPNQFVVDWITEAIEQYIVAFQLFNSMTYFAD